MTSKLTRCILWGAVFTTFGLLSACTGPNVFSTLFGKIPYGENGKVYKIGKPYYIDHQKYYPTENYHYDKVGIASWYGPNFNGGPTANGGVYNMHAISAAHKTLPISTIVLVTNLENGKSLKIKINDRGPYVKDRIIDLSYESAKLLGVIKKGTAMVRVQVLIAESKALKDYMVSHGKKGFSLHSPFDPVPEALFEQYGGSSTKTSTSQTKPKSPPTLQNKAQKIPLPTVKKLDNTLWVAPKYKPVPKYKPHTTELPAVKSTTPGKKRLPKSSLPTQLN